MTLSAWIYCKLVQRKGINTHNSQLAHIRMINNTCTCHGNEGEEKSFPTISIKISYVHTHAYRSEVPSKLHNLFCQLLRHFSDTRSLIPFPLFHAASAHYCRNFLFLIFYLSSVWYCTVCVSVSVWYCTVCVNKKIACSLYLYFYITRCLSTTVQYFNSVFWRLMNFSNYILM